MTELKVVLDTNIILVSIPSKSKYSSIFDGLLDGVYELAISNDILLEYHEILAQQTSSIVADNISELLLTLKNVEKVNIYFKWGLIDIDKDDNKFVDCAIAAGVDYIVTNDRHFNVLKKVGFPQVNVIKIDRFLEIVQELSQN